jgi:hypothetical protein
MAKGEIEPDALIYMLLTIITVLDRAISPIDWKNYSGAVASRIAC